MKYRVKDVIKSLESLPEPQYEGQVLNVPIFKPISYDIGSVEEPANTVVKHITLIAERYATRELRWLEWMYDI